MQSRPEIACVNWVLWVFFFCHIFRPPFVRVDSFLPLHSYVRFLLCGSSLPSVQYLGITAVYGYQAIPKRGSSSVGTPDQRSGGVLKDPFT